MTTEEYNVLNQLTYFDLNTSGNAKGKTLSEICRSMQSDVESGKIDSKYAEAITAVADGKYPGLSDIVLKDSLNSNDSTGLVAFAFESPDGVICSYRGSEGSMLAMDRDWSDNVAAGITGVSSQYADAVAFARRNSEGENLYLTGHSKGMNLAMYVASQVENCKGGEGFNGQGFPAGALSPQEIMRLKNSGMTNYVTENDWVGSLLFQPGNVKYVKGNSKNPFNVLENHGLLNVCFDENGEVYPTSQDLIVSIIVNLGIDRLATKVTLGYEITDSVFGFLKKLFSAVGEVVDKSTRKTDSGFHEGGGGGSAGGRGSAGRGSGGGGGGSFGGGGAASGAGASGKDRITVPLDEMITTVARYERAENELMNAYGSMYRAMAGLENCWKGLAYLALMAGWRITDANIKRADENMKDAVTELKQCYDIFTNAENSVQSAASSLDTGESPFM